MSDTSRSMQPNTAPEDITSNNVNSNAGGNALLDAENALSGQPQTSEEDSVATNFSENSASKEPSDGKTLTTTGAYPVDQSQMDKANYPSPTMREEDPEP